MPRKNLDHSFLVGRNAGLHYVGLHGLERVILHSVFVSCRNAALRDPSCLMWAASDFSSDKEISHLMTRFSSIHWSSASRHLIGARYCWRNSGFDSSDVIFSFWPFNLAFSNRSITSTTRFHTRLASEAWENIASLCVDETLCRKENVIVVVINTAIWSVHYMYSKTGLIIDSRNLKPNLWYFTK